MKIKQYQKVYESIREDILQGFLLKNDQLPSIRQAAIQFQVSKTTIEKAYMMLEDEGYIYASAQRGFYVLADQESLVLRKQILRPIYDKSETYRCYLSKQAIDKDIFDFTIWKRYLKNVMELQDTLVTYGEVEGEYRLRQALSRYAYQNRKVFAHPENIIVAASVQVLLYQILSFHNMKKNIAIHHDGYIQAKRVIQDLGFRLIPFEKISKKFLQQHHIDMIYIQHPMVCLTKTEREDILSWVKEKNTYIIEDDHNGELMNFHRLESAWQKECPNHMIYIGSFSRLLPSSFRLSYAVLPQSLMNIFDKQKKQYAPSASKIEQLALANYIIDGHLKRYIKKIMKYYALKSQSVYIMLCEIFSKKNIQLESVKLRYVITLEESIDMDVFDNKLKKNGICIDMNNQKIFVSFAGITLKDLHQALQKVHEILQSMK